MDITLSSHNNVHILFNTGIIVLNAKLAQLTA